MHAPTFRGSLIVAAVAAFAFGCRGPGDPRGGSAEERAPSAASSYEAQARAIEESKERARQGAIEALYAEWRQEYRAFRAASNAAISAAAAQPEAGPVRSVDEILREADPTAHDPEVQRQFEAWLAKSRRYDARLRELASDPETDPRSPLRADVREALDESVSETPPGAKEPRKD